MKSFDIKKTIFLGLLSFVIFLITTTSSAYAAEPVLFFSDLDSGPKTGWENASTKGAAVSIWGLNFGAAGPESKITVAGQDIVSTDSQFVAEWNTAAIARGMRMITFWLKPTSNDGAGTITVTTPEGQSNELSFTVRAGNIYYASTTGSDSNNGRTTSSAWRNAFKGLSMAPGDILYLRQGVYATSNNSNRAYIWMDNEHGMAGNPLAWVSYPAEVATIGDGTLPSGFGQYNYTGHGDNHDITIAKIKFNVTEGGVTSGQSETPWYNFRVIGNDIQNATKNSWGGAIYFAYFWNVKIFGNYLNNNGFDKYDHSIYINSYPLAGAGFDSHDLDIGWNEIANQNNGSNIKLHPKDSGSVAKLYNIYVHDNYIHDSPNESFELGARAGYVAIYNNLIVNTGTGAAGYNGGVHLTYQNSGSNPVVKIYSNTFINTGTNSSFAFVDGATTNVDIRNNIFYDPALRNFLDAGGWRGTATATNNHYFNFTPPSWEANPVAGDASFISSTDFHLRNNSQLIDAGVDVGAVISKDHDGTPRPQGSAYDIGAYEYFSSSVITSAPDTQTPSVPANLSAAVASSTQINLSWTASTDNTAVTGYKIYRGGVQIATSTAATYSDTGLTASMAYSYAVSAYDAAGNNSSQSASVSATTQADPVVTMSLGGPVLNFSDLDSGPKTGNTDGLGSGAIVSIWGNNLGSSQESSQIYVGGIPVAYVYYWGNADGNPNAGPADLFTYHKMQTISFSVPAGAPDGVTTISVAVGGVQSNTLPFTVRTGNIYFIKAGGNNANAGSWQSPWGTFETNASGKMTNGDIAYVAGTFNAMGGTDGLLIRYNDFQNTAERPTAVIGYPGSSVYLNGSSNGIGVWNAVPYPQYWVFSKLKVETGSTGISSIKGMRAIANEITGPSATGQSGAISGSKDSTSGVKSFGNYIHDFGLNSYDIRLHHVFYLSNRDGTPNEAYELGWNYLLNNHARGGLHNYDEGICGDFTGIIKVHNNVVVNQSGTSFDIGGSGGGYDGTGCLKVPFEVYNNLFINSGQTPFADPAISVTFSGTKNHIKFYNNTLYGWSSGEAVYIQDNGSATHNFGGTFEWVNNIVVDTNNLPYSHPVYYKTPSVHSNNIWYNGGDGNPTSMPVWDAGALSANPLFVNPSAGDFRLQSTSPAINAGASLVSSVIARDLVSISRPQGSAYDIGAYEYCTACVASSVPTPTPPAPTPAQPTLAPATPTTPTPASTTPASSSPSAPTTTSGGGAGAPSSSSSATHTQTASSAITEGSLIRGPDGIKVYIVNAHGVKRHIFNPAIFAMYGHFRWDAIKEVNQQTLDSYITSDLYRADGDTKVFSLHEIDESKGLAQKRWFNMSGDRFIQKGYTFQQVFIINPRERDYYQEGMPIAG